MKPILAITMGDPVGIGPEIIVKAFQTDRLSTACRPIVIGHAAWMKTAASQFAPSLSVRPVSTIGQCRFESGCLEVLDVDSLAAGVGPLAGGVSAKGDRRSPLQHHSPFLSWQYGVPHPDAAQAALNAIRSAAQLAMKGEVSAIVTAPINKEALKQVGFAHPGHTEFLAELAGVKKFGMMMVGGGLKIMLSTIHIALQQVSGIIRKELILGKIALTHQVLESDFDLPSGRIAVAAFNPHGGEAGLFGTEEIQEIAPAVLLAKEKGINVSGPYPADTLFFHLKEGRFDAAVAIYHDQALIPIKLLAFGQGINVTAGLPFIRTSVDHGTAYDIAGKGIADAGSLIEAALLAVEMAACRGRLRQ